MKKMKLSRKIELSVLIGVPVFLITIILFWAFFKEEVERFKSPDNKYEAVIQRYRHLNVTFMAMPGSGSDYSCFLSIYETDSNKHMGTAPVAVACWARGVIWTKEGAYIDARPGPEWDFGKHTCIYYDHRDEMQSGL